MHARAAFRPGAGLICLLAAAMAAATPPAGPTPMPQAPEVMLYVTVPLGGGARQGMKLPNLSLRVGQARMGGNSGNPAAGDPMQHRELFRLEVFGPRAAAAPDMRLELGGRMAYDLHRGVFGLRADGWKRPSVIPMDAPAFAAIPPRQVVSARHERILRLTPGLHPTVQGNGALKPNLP